MENMVMKKELGKREVGTLIKKLSQAISNTEDSLAVEEIINSTIEDAIEVQIEDLGDNDFDATFMVNVSYKGNISNSEMKKLDESFYAIEDVSIISITIEKRKNKYSVEAYVWVTFRDKYGNETSSDVPLKKIEVTIENEFMTLTKKSILDKIESMQKHRLQDLLMDEGLGDVVTSDDFINEIKSRLTMYANKLNSNEETMCYNLSDLWYKFLKLESVSDIAYSMGYKKSDIERNYDLISFCESEMDSIVFKYREYVDDSSKEIDEENTDLIRDLSYFYALTALKRHATNSNVLGIERVKNETIPKILNGGFDHSFYVKNAEKGLSVIRK